MTSSNFKMEVLSGPERRRRWSTAAKLAIIQETYEADATVSIVARRHGIQPNQLFAWRKLASQGALTATAAEEERGGSVCLNSFGRFAKWISASIMPPPSLVSAR